MNRWQRIARFNLVLILIGFILSLTAICILYFAVGLPIQRALGGFVFIIVICGLTPFSSLLYKKESGKVSFDERDLLIHRKASLRAYSIFWFLFVLAAVIPFFVLGPKGTISVKYLPALVFGGMITVLLVQSIVTLEEYGWKSEGEKL